MKRGIIIFVLVMVALVAISCSLERVAHDVEKKQENVAGKAVEPPKEEKKELVPEVKEEPAEEPKEEVKIPTSCTDNKECSNGEVCIDNTCGKITNLYENKKEGCSLCAIATVTVKTSDGEEYTVTRGRGGYTAAGGMEWKVVSSEKYCKGSEVIVPFSFVKKNSGVFINEEFLTLKKGETSRIIKHPRMPGFTFTLSVEDVVESCS